jgi:hypothetical protein
MLERLHHDSQWINEKTTWYYTHQLTDELGANLGSTNISTLTATWYELDTPTKAIILDWDAKDVKGSNGGTCSTTGKFELRLTPLDTIILDATRVYEQRRLLLTWVHTNGKTFRHEVDTIIRNLHKVA